MNRTPASLLERLRQPDPPPETWARLVELFTPLLFHWARQVGMQEADAADLVQDVFALLLEKLPEFNYDPGRSFHAWLRTVTLNKWRDSMKQRNRQPAGDAGLLAAVANPNGPEGFWEAEYCHHLVGRALALMKAEFQPTTWRACWAFVVEGKPASEVAANLGISENAVYVAKSRVLRRLRLELEGLL